MFGLGGKSNEDWMRMKMKKERRTLKGIKTSTGEYPMKVIYKINSKFGWKLGIMQITSEWVELFILLQNVEIFCDSSIFFVIMLCREFQRLIKQYIQYPPPPCHSFSTQRAY
jgi:hypothetical protein